MWTPSSRPPSITVSIIFFITSACLKQKCLYIYIITLFTPYKNKKYGRYLILFYFKVGLFYKLINILSQRLKTQYIPKYS